MNKSGNILKYCMTMLTMFFNAKTLTHKVLKSIWVSETVETPQACNLYSVFDVALC